MITRAILAVLSIACGLAPLEACRAKAKTNTDSRPIAAGETATRVGVSTGAQAAQKAAETSAECSAIRPFFWEIGDAKGAIVSGSVGGARFTASTKMPIASASKLFWGAYVVERFKSNMAAIDVAKMTMRSGYTGISPGLGCLGATTVGQCLTMRGNDQRNPDDEGSFFYNSGHFEKYAVDLGLGPLTNATLATEIESRLGSDIDIQYKLPLLAGGIETTPSDVAKLLRKIIDGTLALGRHLGENAVCTLPSACPQARESPVPEAWHYSYGHWVEDDPKSGDGAFSSPGLFGFYPWIAATKNLYGIVAREEIGWPKQPVASTAYWKSVLCGRSIRRAYGSGR